MPGLQEYAGAKEPRRTPQGFELASAFKPISPCLLLPSCFTPTAGGRDARLAWWSPLREVHDPQRRRQRWAGQPGWVISAA